MHFHVRMFIAIVHYFEQEDKESEAKCYLSTPEALTYNQFSKRGVSSVYEALGDGGWNFVNGKTSIATVIDHGQVGNDLFEFNIYTNDYADETGVTVYYRDVKTENWMKKLYADVTEAGFDDKETMQMNAFRMQNLTTGGQPLSGEHSPIGLPTWYIEKDWSILGQYDKDKKTLAHYGEHAQRIFANAFATTYLPFYAALKLYEIDDYCRMRNEH